MGFFKDQMEFVDSEDEDMQSEMLDEMQDEVNDLGGGKGSLALPSVTPSLGKAKSSKKKETEQSFSEDSHSQSSRVHKGNTSSYGGSMMGGSKKGNSKQNKENVQRWLNLDKSINEAKMIMNKLTAFDKNLADSVKPLTDIRQESIYHKVIDKFANGQEKMEDLEMLISAVERMQVKFKNGTEALEGITSDIKKFQDKKAIYKNDE